MKIPLAKWRSQFKGMPNSKKYWKFFKDNLSIMAQVELYYAHWENHKKDQYFIEQMDDFVNRTRELRFKMDTQFATKTSCMLTLADFERTQEALVKADIPDPIITWTTFGGLSVPSVSLGNCQSIAATPILAQVCGGNVEYVYPIQEKGNNPMRIDNTTATAYVTAPKSDDAISRDYLISRLAYYDGWRNPKLAELNKLFNLGEDGRPQTYLQLIDAIKNDKFSLDDKAVKRLKRLTESLEDSDDDMELEDYGYGPFYGLIFTDFPKADRDGYDAAVKQLESLVSATRDTIMVKSPADGLAALQALEAWTPTSKAN